MLSRSRGIKCFITVYIEWRIIDQIRDPISTRNPLRRSTSIFDEFNYVVSSALFELEVCTTNGDNWILQS